MSDVDEFLVETMPRFTEAETALHNGDAGPRMAMWSRREPVTLFGAAVTKAGWAEVGPTFKWLGSTFSDCTSYRNEVIAAGASAGLAYTVAFEHTTASVNGGPGRPYMLRVTTIFRREDGEWKVVHRHGDSLASQSAAELVAQLSSGDRAG
jgi:ketosteroid isomerase-like protein